MTPASARKVTRIALSPAHDSAYRMARALLMFAAWQEANEQPIDFDRAMLIDFAAEYPRAVAPLVAEIGPILRAYGLEAVDLSDLFAQRRLHTRRERFTSVITDLGARGLVEEVTTHEMRAAVSLTITSLGADVAGRFTSPLSNAIRLLCVVLAREWRKPAIADLLASLRKTIPDASREIADLSEPFRPWDEAGEWARG